MKLSKTTLPEMWWPLMYGPTIETKYCPVCGVPGPLEKHHPVRRSAGKLFDENGREIKKPTISLCHECHHLLAHKYRLFFNFVQKCVPYEYGNGHWEYLETKEPTSFLVALTMDGWKPM